MNENDLYRSFQEIDDDILERSEGITKKSRKNSWIKWAVMAVGVGLVMLVGILAIRKEMVVYVEKDSAYGYLCQLKKRYNKDVYEVMSSLNIHWPEGYNPLYVRYREVTFNKNTYDAKTFSEKDPAFVAFIDKSLLGEVIGFCKAKDNSGKFLEEELSVREILGVSSEILIAVEMENKYFVFQNKFHGTKTLGDMLESYNMSQFVNLSRFELNEEIFTLKEDDKVWELLAACSDAEYVTNSMGNHSETIYFIVESETLGINKTKFSVNADGYAQMNGSFFIGEEAAKEIIDYVKANSKKAGYEPYTYKLAGTLVNVNEEYIWMDDAALCRNKYNGKTFRISIDQTHIRRYFECGVIAKDQLFVLEFTGTINQDTNEIEVGSYCVVYPYADISSRSLLDVWKWKMEVALVDEVKNK